MVDKSVLRNRIIVAKNNLQNDVKKVLCVCTAGVLRSPTLAEILTQDPFLFNTRAVGSSREFALIPIDVIHVLWADEIVVFSEQNLEVVNGLIEAINIMKIGYKKDNENKKVHLFDIPDIYNFRDPNLVSLLKIKSEEIFLNT